MVTISANFLRLSVNDVSPLLSENGKQLLITSAQRFITDLHNSHYLWVKCELNTNGYIHGRTK